MKTFVFIIVVVCAEFSLCQKPTDSVIDIYCNLQCTMHTGQVYENSVCLRRCEAGSCQSSLKVRELNDVDRQYILDWHNHVRNQVALGKDKRGGNHPATNMMILNYDKDHETTTYCWGVRCEFEHDKCRRTPNFEYCGQNLYMRGVVTTQEFEISSVAEIVDKAMTGWYEEISLTYKNILQNYQGNPKWGHFTQLVWHNTETVGCTILYFKEGVQHTEHVLCNYGPGGNYLNQPVYEFGDSASKCPQGNVNKEYTGLCGDLTILSTNRTKIDYGGQSHLAANVNVFVLFAVHYLRCLFCYV